MKEGAAVCAGAGAPVCNDFPLYEADFQETGLRQYEILPD